MSYIVRVHMPTGKPRSDRSSAQPLASSVFRVDGAVFHLQRDLAVADVDERA